MFSKFFINRPIFATVLALLIVVAGLVTLNILPVAQFPEITPPTVQVSAVYPGANAETVAQTVGIPIEQQVNGVDGMLYMSSNSSSSGAYSLTITFAVGTDIDMATVQVQNRVSIAQSSLPEPVVVQGVTVQKQSSNIVMFLTMTSQDSVYNSLYLTNYAKLNLVDQLTRVPGVGAVNVMGAGDYSMRIWLDPEAMRIRNISPQQVYQSIQSQSVEVSAGYIGQPIGQDNNNAFQYTLNVQGRLKSPEQFGNIIIRREQDGAMLRLKDIARIDLGSASYSVVSRLNGKPTAAIAIYQQPGSNSLDVSKGVKAKMEELAESFPSGVAYNVTLDTTDVIHASIDEVMVTFFETTLLVILVIFLFLQNWRAVIIPCITIPVSLIGTFAVMAVFGFSINTLTLFGLILAVAIVVDDAIVVVENASRLLETGQYSPREAVTKAMQATGITHLADQSVDTLSGGQRQRAWIAMVLAQETAIMLLDEPTTWLDISHQIDLLELLSELNREKGYTLAAVLHDLNQACRYASHLIALREGKIVAQGAPKEIVTAELIERIYGLRCMIIDDPVAGTPLVVPLGRTAPSTANS